MESKWFEKKIPKNNRIIYIPRSIIKTLPLNKYDKIAVLAKKDNQTIAFPTKVQIAMTKTDPSHKFSVPKHFQKYFNLDKLTMKIIKLDCILSTKNSNGRMFNLSSIIDHFKKIFGY